MVTYRFLRGYRGRATGEKHFAKDTWLTSDAPYDWTYLLGNGIVEAVELDPIPESPDLENMTVTQLRALAKDAGIAYSDLRKAELIEALHGLY